MQAGSGMEDQIAAYCTAFNHLKQNFDSRVNIYMVMSPLTG